MKSTFTLLMTISAFFSTSWVSAQFVVGESGFFVRSGTAVFIDSLVLTPAPGNLFISNDALTVSYDPVGGNPSSIARVYSFDTGFSFEGTTGLFYRQDEVGANVEEDLQIAYSPDGISYNETSGSTVNIVGKYISNVLPNVFLKSVTAATSGALPVTLVDFNVRREGALIVLSWVTTYEKNSASFEVQRSLDGKSWLGLNSIVSAGNSLTNQTYTYTDSEPLEERIYYYRLRMNDVDGTFTYSDIKSITLDYGSDNLDIALYPNPSVDRISLKWTGTAYPQKTDLLNITGQKILSVQGPGPAEGIDVKNLPSGIYIVRVTDSRGGVHRSRIVKP